jgi:hypothetical protein
MLSPFYAVRDCIVKGLDPRFEISTEIAKAVSASCITSISILISPLIILTLIWKKGWFLPII